MPCRPFRSCKKLLKCAVALLLLVAVSINLNYGNLYHATLNTEKEAVADWRSHAFAPPISWLNRTNSEDDLSTTLVTRTIQPNILIYNRVPKCGSSTVRFLIGRLRARNRFNYKVHNWPNVRQSLTPTEEAELVRQVASLRRPVLFLRHLHYVDFAKYNLTTAPAYFNMVRDPVDRFISHFYFSRYGFKGWDDAKIKKWLWPMSEELRNMTLEDCVGRGVDRCVADNRENMIAFFCGQERGCSERNDWALAKAKSNIERDFALVGILERLEESLKIAEAILPRYFKSAVTVLHNYPEGGKKTKTAGKKEPSKALRTILENGLKPEMELYNFIKRRLLMQYEILKRKGKFS